MNEGTKTDEIHGIHGGKAESEPNPATSGHPSNIWHAIN